MRFQIVVTTGNSEGWIEQCIRSIAEQKSRWAWKCLIIDDASTDETAQRIQTTLSSIEDPAIRESFLTRRNKTRKGSLANQIKGFEQLGSADNPMDVLIPIDGDDWLFSHTALDTIAALYEQTSCWITHGGLLTWPEGNLCTRAVPAAIIEAASYRQSDWITSHLRSFRSHLWNAINREDLLDQNGDFYDVASDMATMFPMLEMAADRIAHTDKAVYVYNCTNPESHHNKRREKQYKAELEIRAKAQYPQLTAARHQIKKIQNLIGYLIISDTRPAQTIRLINSLKAFHGSPRIHCVHDFERSLLGYMEASDRLTLSPIESTFQRGLFSEVEAILNGINQAIWQWQDLEWLIVLDHQCHPLLSLGELISALKADEQDAYIHAEHIDPQKLHTNWQETCWQRYGEGDQAHPFHSGFRCFAGSPWMALRRNAAEVLVNFHRDQPWLAAHYKDKDERNGINYSCESYLHTILCNETKLNINSKPICWTDWSSGLPKLLTEQDWELLFDSGYWIASRFQEPQSNRLIDRIHDRWMLTEQIQQANERSIAHPTETEHRQNSTAKHQSANTLVSSQP